MVGIVRNKRMVFKNGADLERFEKQISEGVTNNITKKMLDEKTKNIKITRGSENVPRGL